MQRIEVQNSNKDLKIVAFKVADHKGTLVALNRSLHPVQVEVDWAGMEFEEKEVVDAYSPNSIICTKT